MATLEKRLEDILTDIKPKKERQEELLTLIPELKDGKKVYYSGNNYVVMKDNEIYSGTENGKYETRANMSFPFVFFLMGVYVGRYGAALYEENENMKNDKTLSVNENGLLVLKDHGVVGNESIIKNILDSYEKVEEENAEEIINQYISDAEKEISLLTEGMTSDLDIEDFEVEEKPKKKKKKETTKKKEKKTAKKSKKK